jgi:hypothetical protein
MIVSVLAANVVGQTHQEISYQSENDFKNELFNMYQLKSISKQLLLDSLNLNSTTISTGIIMQITGGVLIIGFLLSITVFKQDIFTALPLSLLGSGIALIFIGSSLE